jgi:Holliday junction resolvasome RuvABC ATP-dependent DNA helicase subunit
MARRPPAFYTFIGQQEAIDRVCRLGQGAQARSKPFPHLLLRGPSGSGKTHLAKALASAFGATFIEARGQLSYHELAARFAQVKLHDFVFIDEAHFLKPRAQDLLIQVIDGLPITVPTPKQQNANYTNPLSNAISIPPCTVILATDQPGALSNALRRRMADEVPLRLYRPDELKEIAEKIAKTTNLLISPQAARRLAEIAHGFPSHGSGTSMLARPEAESRKKYTAHARKQCLSWRRTGNPRHRQSKQPRRSYARREQSKAIAISAVSGSR